MSSGGKGGSAQQSKNIHGTIVYGFCWGPLDWLKAVIHNGNYLWQGTLTVADDVTDLTGGIADPTYLAPGGSLKLYRGTETQPADVTGCRDKGTVKIEGIHLFFGQETGGAPNLQIIGGRVPRVPTSIVAADDNVADDEQVNPIAAWAEILLDERGGDVAVEDFDAASWLAAGHAAYLARDLVFCSPLVTEQAALRELAKRMLDPFNGFCRWTKEGKLACRVYEWGIDPGDLPILDARVWTKKPQIPLGDWDEVPTELQVNFTNREYEYQEDGVKVPNALARQVRQADFPATIARPDIMRPSQAFRLGVETNRRKGTAPSKATISVAQPFVADLAVGDKVKIDTDPEPGGDGLAQLVRIDRIEEDASDTAKLIVQTDNLVPATAYTPEWTPAAPVDEVSPPLVHFLAVPLPPNAFGWPPAVAILAARPSGAILGFEVFFAPDPDGAFADLGQQGGFAVRAQLAEDLADDETAADITQLDGLDAPDAELAGNTPGGNVVDAGGNTLLALIAELDGDGRIALGADGDPIMEFVSIVDRAPVAGATYAYTILRGRLGTQAREWDSGAVVWIVPHYNIIQWRHPLLSAMLGGVAYFRLVSFTGRAFDETIPIPECSVNMLPADAPSYGGNIDGDTTPDDGPAPNPVTSVTVTPSLSLLVLKWVNPTNVPLKRIFVYESADMSRPAKPQFGFDPDQTFLFRTGLGASETVYFWIEVQGRNGRRTLSGPYNGTTRAGVDLSDIIPGMQLVGIVSTLPDPDGYDIDANPQVVFLTTNRKLYRYDVTTTTWTSEIDGYDLVAGSILAGAISAGAVTATAIGTNLIITTTANIGTAVITDANILSLTAEKIVAGVMEAMILKAAKTATDSAFFNVASPGTTFPAVAFQQGEDGTHYTGLATAMLELPLVSFDGWGVGSGYAENRFGKSTMRFVCNENGGCTPNTSPISWIDLKISYRINGGAWVDVTSWSARAVTGNGTLNISGGCLISGLTSTDVVEFGVRVDSDNDASQLNVTNLSVCAFNI